MRRRTKRRGLRLLKVSGRVKERRHTDGNEDGNGIKSGSKEN